MIAEVVFRLVRDHFRSDLSEGARRPSEMVDAPERSDQACDLSGRKKHSSPINGK